jgi:hypothetical protein
MTPLIMTLDLPYEIGFFRSLSKELHEMSSWSSVILSIFYLTPHVVESGRTIMHDRCTSTMYVTSKQGLLRSPL